MTDGERHSSEHHEPHVFDADELIHHHTKLPDTVLSMSIDAAMAWIGKAASWLWLIVVGIIMWAVIGRYAFGQGSITLEEWQWHVAGAAWLLGLSYTLSVDDHVRVDVLHERFSVRTQAWIELLGITLLLLPFLGFVIYEAIPFVMSSYQQGESSPAPAGLSNRWILKAIMAISFVLLALAAISRLLKVTALLFGVPQPITNAKGSGR
jgi:TRAP-type mannitol/chloroaromatic compound transport system permease small subunit